MASRKATDNMSLAQKVKVLQKLFDFGCKTEKDLQALSMESILHDRHYGTSETGKSTHALFLSWR